MNQLQMPELEQLEKLEHAAAVDEEVEAPEVTAAADAVGAAQAPEVVGVDVVKTACVAVSAEV